MTALNFPRTLCALVVLLASGCAAFPTLQTDVTPASSASERRESAGATPDSPSAPPRTAIEILSRPEPSQVQPARPRMPAPTPEAVAAVIAERSIEVSIPPQSLPQFIDTVFGGVLQAPYFTGPGIAQRRDIVTLRGSTVMSSRRFFEIVQTALGQYGVSVSIENGVVRVFEDDTVASASSAILRSRSTPDTPGGSRPVIQFFELTALDVASVMKLVSEIYPDRGAVRLTPREDINTIVMTGPLRDVASAAAVIDQIDQPKYAGGQIARIEPVYWSADNLAQSVVQALQAEGYRVSSEIPQDTRPMVLLPIPFTNQVLLFSNDPQLFRRALYWAEELDKASALGDQEGMFVYTVRNTSAADLGALVTQVLPAQGPRSPERNAEAAATRPGRPSVARPSSSQGRDGASAQTLDATGRITVDAGGNRLLFRGSPSEFEQARAIMTQLDTSPQQVLVEITIAEVTLTDETRFGVDWYLQQTIGSAGVAFDTRGGSSREPGGLGATYSRVFSHGRVQAALNAIAENKNLNILSTPRLVARSGSQAQILVGTDVPIITSQRAANNQTGGDTDVLQTVQYRQTGVILNMRPVVYGDDRVDIELFQEVSSQEPNRTSSISSPIILNRSVTTQLSLREGMTAVIGGLIQDNYSREQRGVPFLKDAPVVGAAFRSDSVSGTKVELLILVTPYILRTDDEVQDAASVYANAMNRTLRSRGPRVYTLVPWRAPFATPRVHGGAPARNPTPTLAPDAPESRLSEPQSVAPERPSGVVGR
jgi:general secretion pathway protein D